MNPIAAFIETNGRDLREGTADPALEWFAFGRFGNADGNLSIGCQTIWVGFSEERPFRELRQARSVYPDKWRALAAEIYERPLIVSDNRSLLAWLLLGGEALVERSIAEVHLGKWLAPYEVGRIAGEVGFTSARSVSPAALKHAPSKNLRLRVLLRDGRRCRVCGRSPEESVHASLDVHHGIGWGGRKSGLTVEENLFTLCSSCHDGLSPDLEGPLLASIGVRESSNAAEAATEYRDGVAHYRRIISTVLQKVPPYRARLT